MELAFPPVLALGLWGIFVWVVVGLLIGIIAKVLMPGDDPGGIFMTSIIGILGAILGGWLSSKFINQGYTIDEFSDLLSKQGLISLAIAVVGAMLLLLLYRLITGRRG